jgi:hypothetical protein
MLDLAYCNDSIEELLSSDYVNHGVLYVFLSPGMNPEFQATFAHALEVCKRLPCNHLPLAIRELSLSIVRIPMLAHHDLYTMFSVPKPEDDTAEYERPTKFRRV